MEDKLKDDKLRYTILLNARNNIIKMLNYRGYDTSKILNLSEKELEVFDELVKKKINSFDISTNLINQPSENIMVQFLFKRTNEKKIEEDIIKFFSEQKDPSKSVLIFIIMYKDNDNILQNKAYQIYQIYKYFTQIFSINNLQQNIIDHSFVPKHILLSSDEEESILNDYNLDTKRKLPYITKHDPVAKYIGMKPGNICKIIRPSETSGEYISYRYCI